MVLLWQRTSKASGTPHAVVYLFLVSKVIYFLLAFFAPGPSYDTSTELLFYLSYDQNQATLPRTSSWVEHVAVKLVRWDAIYFTSTASRGYVFEQEWAFGWGFTRVVAACAKGLALLLPALRRHVYAALIVSNVSHFLAVLVLYRIAKLLSGRQNSSQKFCVLVVCLHILSPAGLFLCVPYGESLFSLLNFSGFLAYCESRKSGAMCKFWQRDVLLVVAGAFFGTAATVRSNGLLSGAVFAYDVFSSLTSLPKTLKNSEELRYLVCLGFGGLLIVIGFALPQYIAYREYCVGDLTATPKREWCEAFPPSIYIFVQRHYWNVGFLRYWTLSNVPLFLLAAPMLTVTFCSGIAAFSTDMFKRSPKSTSSDTAATIQEQFVICCQSRMALPQIVLALLAFTSFHCQTITRISSGYPCFYLWAGTKLVDECQKLQRKPSIRISEMTVKFFVVFASVQAVLYATFLPPA